MVDFDRDELPYVEYIPTPDDWQSLECHPMCLAFPEMTEEEFAELENDIAGIGLHYPIVLAEGKILDGRHRHRACVNLGLRPIFVAFGGPGSPYDYVIATNLKRRNLSPAQKIEVMSNLVEIMGERARARQRQAAIATNAKLAGETLVANLPEAFEAGKVRDEVAKQVGVSPRTAQDALTVKRQDPELWEDVKAGKKAISTAAREVRERAQAVTAYTVAQWESMPKNDRTALIEASGTKGMNAQSNDSIGWARWSWNPVTGCLHNCAYCYAREIAGRFKDAFPHGFEPAFVPERLGAPINMKPRKSENPAERNIFTCSMADLFGKWVPDEWIAAVLETVRASPQWNFPLLTKFPQRLTGFEFPDNAWVGATVDAQHRVEVTEAALSEVRAKTKWLSLEPLFEPLTFTKPELFDWVVIGGASQTSESPEFRPPFESLVHVWQQFGRVYFKDNVLRREFPWTQ